MQRQVLKWLKTIQQPMRKRWIYPGNGADPIEVSADYVPDITGPLVVVDLPGYVSPVTGKWVEGRVQRREDLKRTGSRPWEGLQQEKKEAARHNAYADQKVDASMTKAASEAFYQMPPSKRRILERM